MELENIPRVIRGVSIDKARNQTLILLPSFAYAWNLFETCMMDADRDPFEEARKAGLRLSLNKERACPWLENEKAFLRKAKSDPSNSEYYLKQARDSADTRKRRCHAVWREITTGPSPEFIETIEQVSHVLMDMANEIDPSLKPRNDWRRLEEGPVFDAGLIAAEDERPCFDISQPTSIYRKGDGQAFRLLINTDTAYGHNDAESCMATISLVRCLMNFGEVELWIQQGWIGDAASSGVTLFPIHRGQEITPALTWFWLASSYRDGTFSRVVNFALGRRNSGVSVLPQMEHDIYMANAIGEMPHVSGIPEMAMKIKEGKPLDEFQQKSLEGLAKWLASMVRKVVYTDEALEKLDPL